MAINVDHIKELDAEAIADLDGGAFGLAVTRKIREVVKDIVDRPARLDGKVEPRKVILELAFTPVVAPDRDSGVLALRAIHLEPSVKGSVPTLRGGTTDVRIALNGTPRFNRENPDHFEQMPLEFGDDSD